MSAFHFHFKGFTQSFPEINSCFNEAPQVFFYTARSRCEQRTLFIRVNIQKKLGGSIRSHDCYLKRCVQNSLTQYSFYAMKSRVSSNCTRNIHGPSTPENGVNENEVASLVSLSSLKRPMKAKNITNELIEVLFNMIETFRP